MPSLSFYDYAFLVTETADSPKHVAGLQIFSPPPDYDGDYVADLVAALRQRPPGPPFNMRLEGSMLGIPSWVDDEHFDIDYHLRQTRLPAPGNRQQLMDAAQAVLDDNTITSHVKRIRRKFIAIDPNFDAIETVYGMGYRWLSD